MKEMVNNQRKKGLWTQEEDAILLDYIRVHGRGHWNRIPKATGLRRCGKSCRLRWLNYLSPSVKRGDFSQEEEDLIIRLHNLLGNRWSLIAGRVPGRTDNQVKNHWNTHLCKKLGLKKQAPKAVGFSKPQASTHDSNQEIRNYSSNPLESIKVTRIDEPFISVGETLSVDEESTLFEHHGADAFLFYHELFSFNSPDCVDFLGEYPNYSNLIWHH